MVLIKKTPNALCGKTYTNKGMSAGQHSKKDMELFYCNYSVYLSYLDSLYKLWSLWWWRKMTIRGMTRTTPACSMYLAYLSTWSTAELNKKDNGMYLAGTRGPLTHKNHLRGSPPMFTSNPLLCSASETNSRKLVALMCEKVKTSRAL